MCEVLSVFHTELISKELNSSERIKLAFPAQAVPGKLCLSRLKASLSDSFFLFFYRGARLRVLVATARRPQTEAAEGVIRTDPKTESCRTSGLLDFRIGAAAAPRSEEQLCKTLKQRTD